MSVGNLLSPQKILLLMHYKHNSHMNNITQKEKVLNFKQDEANLTREMSQSIAVLIVKDLKYALCTCVHLT